MKIIKTSLKRIGSLKWGNKPNKIIIHHPQFYGNIEELNNLMINMGYSMIGYNYYIRKDGSLWEGRPVEAIGANCYGQNTCSIGVCFEGDYDKDKIMPEVQLNSGIELIKYLMKKYDIKEVDGHRAYYNTSCPGRYFPLEELLNGVKEHSYISIDGGAYSNYKGMPALNLIIRDYSKDIFRVFAWVDNDEGASWAFDIKPPNGNYTRLFKNTNKVINTRNGGFTCSKGSYYKIKAKGYNGMGRVVAENQIVIKIPD
ncbi:peptidoglycan recognition family protein [uncultured Clostridium sp.]|uniref:peptidoglycan recognition protein family protein n=1 Tax=uncultured Clostridium sp. TaxID=59620 RepID=UPI0028E4AF0F|nr:peptidoglycan recognition family protein [uncultured Clostridium sp.]